MGKATTMRQIVHLSLKIEDRGGKKLRNNQMGDEN